MISIDQNFNIEASQYDTYTLRFAFKDYVLTADDMFRFSIKATSNSTDVVFSKDVYHAGYNYIDLSMNWGNSTVCHPTLMCTMWYSSTERHIKSRRSFGRLIS